MIQSIFHTKINYFYVRRFSLYSIRTWLIFIVRFVIATFIYTGAHYTDSPYNQTPKSLTRFID